MPVPKPKSKLQLDEDDWLDIERANINMRHRMQIRRDKNELYIRAQALKAAGELLGVDDAEAQDDES